MSLFISCNRKCDSGCCKNCPQYYTDQEFREYLVFPIGSYWIYQDSATSNTDSIYLFSQHFEMRDLKDIYGYAKYLEQKFSASFNNDTILKFGGAQEYERFGTCFYNEGNPYDSSYISFFSNKNVGDSIWWVPNTLKYSAFYTSKNFEGSHTIQ
jgi:hypothetical protein